MAREIPSAPKVHTTTYSNFRGVDFTNDSTNIWYRRSPSGVNMLPDDSGRPFKRTGWEVVVTADQLATALSKDDVHILKCHYFELAGIDHVVIFAEGGVFKYAEDTLTLLTGSTDADCYTSYDRAFFFEGNGKSAFYIYGNYKVWVYEYVNGAFNFRQAYEGLGEEDITIPTILVATDPSNCSGTQYDAYNLLGNKAQVWYQSNDMFYAYTTGDLSINVDKTTFDTKLSIIDNPNKIYTFTYSSSQWDLEVGGTTTSNVTPSQYGVTWLGDPADNDTIVVLYIYGVLLPNNVTADQASGVNVYTTTLTQFDTELEVIDTGTPASGECLLCTDEYSQPDNQRKAWIQFHDKYVTTSQEDIIRVVFPITTVSITNFPIYGHETDCQYTGNAQINS